MTWLLYGLAGIAIAYLLLVFALCFGGRRGDARAVAGFIPHFVVLFARLYRDPRVPTRHKVLIGALLPYLAIPFDLIPDFIPVAGQLDDAVLVVFVLRKVVRHQPDLIREHWPGPPTSLALILRLAGQRSTTRT